MLYAKGEVLRKPFELTWRAGHMLALLGAPVAHRTESAGPSEEPKRYVRHPLLKEGLLEERAYQSAVVEHALKENVLVVMPTGLGKTAIALRTLAEWHRRYPDQKALMLAPTRPLVEQHARTIERLLRGPPPLVLTGTVAPTRRKGAGTAEVVVATPQVVLNDLKRGALSARDFSIVVFDEAHRARGDYPYVGIAQAFQSPNHRILGITASPGSTQAKVEEIMGNLGVSASGVEFRDEGDSDVAPYLHDIVAEVVRVDNPKEVEAAGRFLRAALDRHAQALRGFFSPLAHPVTPSRRLLLEAGTEIGAHIARLRARGESVPPALWQAQKHQAAAMKIAHALELLETQGPDSLRRYIDRMRTKGKAHFSPSTSSFLKDPEVAKALALGLSQPAEHPKVERVLELVRQALHQPGAAPGPGGGGTRVIVFAHYRDMADLLENRLRELKDPNIHPARFVGQAVHDAQDQGLSQRRQISMLEDFRSGKVNCLVATSVAEEGLDVPSTDLVIFYEPVPSEIRTIQRRGRTGRARAGKVIVLMTRGTQDVGSFYSARGKERRMRHLIEEIKARSRLPMPPQKRPVTLDSYS